MAVCSILIPSDPYRNSHGFDTTEIDLGCVRKAGHVGPHLIKLPDGNYLSWEDDLECTDCYPRECEC